MDVVQAETIGEEWIMKEDAAKYIGANARSIERHARAGRLESKHLPRLPNERQSRVVYRRSDLDAILKGAPNLNAEGKHNGAPISNQLAALTIAKSAEGQAEAWGALTTTLTKLAESISLPPLPSPRFGTSPAFLSLADAAEYSGLAEDTLVALIRNGNVDAIDRDGQAAGPSGRIRKHWRVRRASLDAFGEAKP